MQAYIDPTQIAIVEVVNHRETNQNYIEALADSMRDVGFSTEYPVDVFRSEKIPNHDLNPEATPYVVACGVHRTYAAQQAQLEKIFATVHDGGEEAWVEMMHTDNFQFDPSQNRDIGQPFTPKERRAACTQLLFLPKYMEQTNTALSERFNTSEANIRRWKKDVEELIEHNSPKLRIYGISDGRVERLKTILASTERTNGQGDVITIRKPRLDASEDEKQTFWEKIQMDLSDLREEANADQLVFDFDAVKQHCAQKWNIEVGWYMYKHLHIDQLRKLHQLLLGQDADFIAACTAIHAEAEALSKLRTDLDKALEKTTRMFCKLVDADNKWDDKFKSKWKTFEGLVKSQLKVEMFGTSRWDYDYCETARQFEIVIGNHEAVQEAIVKTADWIADFMKKEEVAAAQRRKKVSKAWTEKRDAAIAAIDAYPRDVSFDRIIAAAEKHLYKSYGYFNKIFDAESVSNKKHIGTLEDEVKSLDRLINAVKKDESWIAEIPAAKPIIEVIAESHEPEFTVTADDLHGISLDEIFQHVADRVIHIPVDDENEVMVQMAQILGKASRGMVGTQLHLLMKFALFAMPKRDVEGMEIEGSAEVSEGEAYNLAKKADV